MGRARQTGVRQGERHPQLDSHLAQPQTQHNTTYYIIVPKMK